MSWHSQNLLLYRITCSHTEFRHHNDYRDEQCHPIFFAKLFHVLHLKRTIHGSKMGLPYSKQINAAFDQVTPLVGAGFEVLQTTKNISLLLLAIQVLTVALLACILTALFALLVTVNPDLETERRALVTPAVQWVAGVFMRMAEHRRTFLVVFWVIVVGLGMGSTAGLYYTSRDPTLRIDEIEDVGGSTQLIGDDIEAIKKGETDQ